VNALGEAGERRWLLEQLLEVVERLGKPAEEPIDYLRQLGSAGSADELALELDDIAPAAVARPGLVTAEQEAGIQALRSQLERMGGQDNAELWTDFALRTAEEWVEVRRLATAALAELRRD
jgi:hypothetical protein